VKNATKFWVCDVVKDWVVDDPTLGAKELAKKIKTNYKVDVPYRRVYSGKVLAHKHLFGD
jgi:hypothetical protein